MRPKKAGPPGVPAKIVEAVPRPVPRMATKVNTWRLRVKGCKSMSSRPKPHQMVSGRTRIRSSGRGIMGESASRGRIGRVAWSDHWSRTVLIEERFLSPQAGHFAGAKWEEKTVRLQ